MKKIKRIIALLLVLVFSLTLVVGCGDPDKKDDNGGNGGSKGVKDPTTVAEEDKFGGVLKVALTSTAKNLDPILYTGVYESNIIINVCDTLIDYSQDLSEIKPKLATEWSVNDEGTEYTFKLRDDVYFQKGEYQDGRQMTAEDIKYSLERSANESALNRLGMLEKIEVINDFEIKAFLKAPDAAFLTALTDAGNSIVPKEEVEGHGDKFGFNLVGTGPFVLEEFKIDQEAVLKRNEDYWQKKPYLDGLVISFITDRNQMSNALRTGEIDMATDLGGESVKIVKEDKNLNIQEVPGLHVAYIYMNLMEGPTADIKVREAIIRAVDIEEMVKGIYQYEEADRAYLALPPGSWGYDESLEDLVPSYDPKLAKELLKEAGYEDGFTLDIYTSDAPDRVKMATILQGYLKDNLNIDLNVNTAEWGTFSDIASKGKADIYGMSWTWYPDPFFFLNKMFHSSEIGALGNGQGFNKPEVDKLLDDALKVTDQEERTKLYKEALKLITENYSRIDYANEKTINGFNPSVEGFETRADKKNIFVSEDINVWLND